ncbi:hypothetical protein LSTR_LSTR004247 [Laodelphax striatellus]|uniref:Uncharacterized protein n=1 Tax=Laodelphax striatellus TaxID=195883 RepID=A0A482XAE6_LAOST|nr:hypothetical protein LSTR_LSTR004247 [Laodelphax striatellus]
MQVNKEEMTNKLAQTNSKVSQLEVKLNQARISGEIAAIPEVQNVSHLMQSLGKFDNTPRYLQAKPFVEQLRVIQDLAPTSWPVWRFKLSTLLMGNHYFFFMEEHTNSHIRRFHQGFPESILECRQATGIVVRNYIQPVQLQV